MKIKIFDSDANMITQIEGVVSPQEEFDLYYKDMYNAVSWEEVVDVPEVLTVDPNEAILTQIALLEQRQILIGIKALMGINGYQEEMTSLESEIVVLQSQLV